MRTMSRLDTPEGFNDLILKSEADRIVRLRDVGHAELGPRNERTVLKRDGIPMVLVVARPQPGANYIAIADEFKRRVEMIQKSLPADIEVSWAWDASRFIRKSVAEVRQTILIAFGLVMFVIFLFLRDWRTTLIPVVVIPVSLIGSCFVMYVAGFSLNVLTLLALVLAIGLVVDDAIVVVEVIYAKIEAGHEPHSAGIEGTREIFFAVVATTVALVAVFMPILVSGWVGRTALPRVRPDPRRRGHHLLLRRADPDADAGDPPSEEARAAALALQNHGAVLPRPGGGLSGEA